MWDDFRSKGGTTDSIKDIMKDDSDFTSREEHYFNYLAEKSRLSGPQDLSDKDDTNQKHS